MLGDNALADSASAYRARIARGILICAVLFAPRLATATAETAVVPPGKDLLLADILGRGATFPGPCTLANGAADSAVIRGMYACPHGQVVVELREPSQAPVGVAQTDKFAITLESGLPPPQFLVALQSHIQAREAEFEWLWVAPPPSETPTLDRDPFRAPPWVTAGVSLFVLLIAGVLVALWRSRRRILSRDAVVPLLLLLLALALRFVAHAAPADIRSVLEEYNLARLGWSALLHLVYAVLPPKDETIWTISRIAGALSVPLLYAVVRARFRDPLVAAGAAATLAVTPLLVRFSASDTPYILLSAAFLGAIAAYDAFAESGSVGAIALALGLLTAAMQLRPDAPWLILPATCLAFARPLPQWRTRLLRLSIAACVVLFVAINTAATLAAVTETGRRQGGYWEHVVIVAPIVRSPWGVSDMTPPSLAALVVLGALAAFFQRRTGALWIAAVLIADPFAFPAGYDNHGITLGQYANARYYIPAMHLACGLAGLGVAALIRATGRWMRRDVPAPTLVAVAIVCLAAAPRIDLLWRMWTPQTEYEFFRSGLAQLDPECRLVTLNNTRDAGFIPFDYLVPGRTIDLLLFLEDPRGTCFVYYRCANCYSPDVMQPAEQANFAMHPACRAIEERFDLQPILEMELKVLPYRGERYARDPVPVGFYRLRELAPSGTGPAPAPTR